VHEGGGAGRVAHLLDAVPGIERRRGADVDDQPAFGEPQVLHAHAHLPPDGAVGAGGTKKPTRTGGDCARRLDCTIEDFNQMSVDQRKEFVTQLMELWGKKYAAGEAFKDVVGGAALHAGQRPGWHQHVVVLGGLLDPARVRTRHGPSPRAYPAATRATRCRQVGQLLPLLRGSSVRQQREAETVKRGRADLDRARILGGGAEGRDSRPR